MPSPEFPNLTDDITPMEQILEHALAEAGKTLPETEAPSITCQIHFKDASGAQGQLKRGPLPRTYTLAAQATSTVEGPRGPVTQRIPGKLLETVFHGTDIARIVTVREVAEGPALATPASRLWTPGQ